MIGKRRTMERDLRSWLVMVLVFTLAIIACGGSDKEA